MRRRWLYIFGLLLVIAAVVVIYTAVKAMRSHDDKTSLQTTSAQAKPSKACQIFTAADARTLMGESTKGGQTPAILSSPDVDVSSCTYNQSNGTGIEVSDRKTASLLARVPITQRGVVGNNNEFGPLKPTTVQDVSGYGNSAYWDAEHGQLNILKNNNWYILSYGTAPPADRNLQQTEQLADLLINKL